MSRRIVPLTGKARAEWGRRTGVNEGSYDGNLREHLPKNKPLKRKKGKGQWRYPSMHDNSRNDRLSESCRRKERQSRKRGKARSYYPVAKGASDKRTICRIVRHTFTALGRADEVTGVSSWMPWGPVVSRSCHNCREAGGQVGIGRKLTRVGWGRSPDGQ